MGWGATTQSNQQLCQPGNENLGQSACIHIVLRGVLKAYRVVLETQSTGWPACVREHTGHGRSDESLLPVALSVHRVGMLYRSKAVSLLSTSFLMVGYRSTLVQHAFLFVSEVWGFINPCGKHKEIELLSPFGPVLLQHYIGTWT
jgi:hypothetical protein